MTSVHHSPGAGMRVGRYRIKIKGGYFIDDVFASPVDVRQHRFRLWAVGIGALGALLVLFLAWRLCA